MTTSHLPYPQCCVHQRTPGTGGMRRSWAWLLHSPPAALVASRDTEYLVSDELVQEHGIWHCPAMGTSNEKGPQVAALTHCQLLGRKEWSSHD